MADTMSVYATEPWSDHDRKNNTLELTSLSQRSSSVDDRSSDEVEYDVYALKLGLGDYREPYSPWTGVKTAVTITVILLSFVVYIIVRSRCTPEWRRSVCIRIRRAVRSLTPSWLLLRLHLSDDDEDRSQSPVTAETAKQCLQRIEHELTEVINDQKSTCSGDVIDVSDPACDAAVSDLIKTEDKLDTVVITTD